MSLNCHNVRDLVSVYKDGAASDETGADIREHLETCSSCRAYYREYERMDKVIYVPESPYPADMNYAVLASRIRRSHLMQSLATIASMAAIVALTVSLTRLMFGRRD